MFRRPRSDGQLDRQRDDKRTPLARPRAAHLDAAAVHLDKMLDQRQTDTETAPRHRYRAFYLRKHDKHPLQLIGGNADAVVLHRYVDLGLAPSHSELDAPTAIGVLGSIGEQIHQNLGQARDIHVDQHAGLELT